MVACMRQSVHMSDRGGGIKSGDAMGIAACNSGANLGGVTGTGGDH